MGRPVHEESYAGKVIHCATRGNRQHGALAERGVRSADLVDAQPRLEDASAVRGRGVGPDISKTAAG